MLVQQNKKFLAWIEGNSNLWIWFHFLVSLILRQSRHVAYDGAIKVGEQILLPIGGKEQELISSIENENKVLR